MSVERLRELISPQEIAGRVAELGARVSRDYAGLTEPLIVVGVLKGSFIFLADLLRHLSISPTIEFLRVASYGAATESSGVVAILKDLECSIMNREVLIVEDIVDTGLTITFLLRHLQASQPKQVKICTLLDKPARRKVTLEPDYVGFTIDDLFVVGYGLDYGERHRQLPGVCVLETNGHPG